MMIFKHIKDKHRFYLMHPTAVLVAASMNEYCFEHGMPLVITSTVSTTKEDIKLNRISSTHRTGRAFDIRIKHWELKEIGSFVEHFNELFRAVGAISSETKERNLCVLKSDHIHVQIDKSFEIDTGLE